MNLVSFAAFLIWGFAFRLLSVVDSRKKKNEYYAKFGVREIIIENIGETCGVEDLVETHVRGKQDDLHIWHTECGALKVWVQSHICYCVNIKQ